MSTSQPVTLQLWSVGPKLIPFLKTACLYFVLQPDQPCLSTVCFKCLPIISLIIFIFLNGISFSKEHAFSRRILTGLIFSCFGDAFLVWPSCFILGVCMFAVAQIMYMTAFGFAPFNAKLGAFVYALSAMIIYTLMPGLDGVLRVGVPVYTLLIGTMSWRAVARIQVFKKPWTWTKFCGGLGSILFVISDTLLGFHHFHGPVPFAQYSIMSTYYVGQLGITLSTVDTIDNKISVAKR
ncbi:lysoplasmalogenase-like protein TMEM86A isoform X2 [Phymastichus coffea]|uniref:lysoplasmalogenase-like protein TMEM86A isoform X2 n=1 Tax=Phymastichus coffea TaxID=108790 RepID=UPI00273B076E|nr:lysoplasmalogenase-like protein TMEM86A isoform X2 [Phymastichus coffea]